jgi:hypothetical protein
MDFNLLRTKYVPNLVKIHRRILILECSQGCCAVKIWPLDLWPWKSLGFNPIDFQGQRSRGQIFTAEHPCEHPRINILQWILTNLGTYLVLRRVWNHIDFQGQMSRGKSIGFQTLVRTMHVPRLIKIHWRMLILECSQGCYAVKIWPDDLDRCPWKSIGFQIVLRTKYVP